ncbi:MAG: diguanylate cyclase [Thermovirgaceae bacterium]
MNIDDDFVKNVLEELHDGLYIVDRQRVIRYWNRAAERITGFPASEVVGKPCSDDILTHVDAEGRNLCQGDCPLSEVLKTGCNTEAEVYLHHKEGHRKPVSVRVSPIRDEKGQITGAIELFTDLTGKEAYVLRVKELEVLAMMDCLTELPNRRYMEKELSTRIAERKRYGVPFGVLFIDIDHFKEVNDTWGHNVGDRVLKNVARNFTSNSRPFDVYGRWGGEEFLGLIRNIEGEELVWIGERFRMLVANSYILHQGKKISVTLSMGATVFKDGDTSLSVLKRVDALLYESKSAGRNRLTFG